MDISPSIRASLFALWSNRAMLERFSEARFGRLSRELAAIGAHAEVIALATRASSDEHRHAALCASMADHFRAEGGLPIDRALLVDAEPSLPRRSAPPTRESVLTEVVAVACLGETFNAAYLTASLAGARDPATRDATHELLRDEVVHARLGWAHLAAERTRGNVSFLASRLPQMLHDAFGDDLGALYDPPEPSADFALLSRAARVALFQDTLNEVIFPGVEALGIDAAASRAWLAAGPLAQR